MNTSTKPTRYQVRNPNGHLINCIHLITAEATASRRSRIEGGAFEVWDLDGDRRVTTYVDGTELPNYKR